MPLEEAKDKGTQIDLMMAVALFIWRCGYLANTPTSIPDPEPGFERELGVLNVAIRRWWRQYKKRDREHYWPNGPGGRPAE